VPHPRNARLMEGNSVIASAAKQSSAACEARWIASSLMLLAMTGDAEMAKEASAPLKTKLRHCERSEAIQSGLRGPLDCFVANAPRNDGDAACYAPSTAA